MNDNPATVISPIRIIGQGAALGHQRIQSVPDRPTGSFQRLVNGGSFELVNYQPGEILYLIVLLQHDKISTLTNFIILQEVFLFFFFGVLYSV